MQSKRRTVLDDNVFEHYGDIVRRGVGQVNDDAIESVLECQLFERQTGILR